MLAMWEHEKNRRDLRIFMIAIVFSAFCFITTSRIKKPGMIYILEWTTKYKEPFSYMQMKREAFTTRKCHYQNCYLTDNVAYFDNVTDFDVILFNMANLEPRRYMILPESRTDDQVYIFVSTESAANYPVGPDFNMFFNWTMTYKLDSDVPVPYVAVWNKKGDLIGPAANITWVKRMIKPTSNYIIQKLRHKRIAAAWFVSTCGSNSNRLEFVTKLRNAMAQYGLPLDIYGDCGNKDCPRQRIEECYGLLETNYYFYLAFENSFSEDYVTEKFLTAAEHYTVPVLYGGANYSRFMPKGMYIDARELGPQKTAKMMSELIRNRKLYYKYFKFHNYYVFHAAHDSVVTDPVCNFCAMLNDKRKRNERRVYALLTQWWNGVHLEKTEKAKDPIIYYKTRNDEQRKKLPKVYIENPNQYALVLEETKAAPLLSQIYNYFFEYK